MGKFWMMGGAAIAASVVVMAWNCHPVRSTETLLGKAQSEFAIKARDALVQRGMAQASPTPAEVSAPLSVAQLPYVVASLEPVAAPVIAAPASQGKTTEPQLASLPDSPAAEYAGTPKLAPAVTPAPALTTVTTQVVTPTAATRRGPVKATYKSTHKARAASHQPRTNVVARRYGRDSYGSSMPYNLEALRARAPEIAAAIARYM